METLPPSARFRRSSERPQETTLTALVVLWSWDEPTRVGELIVLPPTVPGQTLVLGRGATGTEAATTRLTLFRHRPERLEPTGPLLAPSISRDQLRITPLPSGGMQVENVGRSGLLLNGARVDIAEVQPDDVLELEDQLLLLCVQRPERLPLAPEVFAHPFGDVDDFGLVGESPAVWELRGRIGFCAAQQAHVLIVGPSGSGKELVARAVHALSSRKKKALVSRNAATFPEGLIDAELFGNARNYPNSGMLERPGLLGEADGSTLFLDEFGELPIDMQSHLLRVMDQGEYQRLGEANVRRSDFRLVAATNRPESHLKHDVLARLKLRIPVPDLNTRREDIPLLTRLLLKRMAAQNPALGQRFFEGGPTGEPRISPTLMTALVRHDYSTHVRELEGLLWHAIGESQEDFIDLPVDLPSARESTVRLPLQEETPSPPPNRLEHPTPPPQPFSPPGWELKLEPKEKDLLTLCRRYRFNLSEVSRDPACPVERATADLIVRVLMFKALAEAEWQQEVAARLMAGTEDPALEQRLRERLETTLENLQRRLEDEGEEPLRQKLQRTYRASFRYVEAVLAAVKEGKAGVGVSNRGPGKS